VANETDNYQLTVGGFEGDIQNALANHNGRNFATHDRDHNNCAANKGAGWWYRDGNCAYAKLNLPDANFEWYGLSGTGYTDAELKYSQMWLECP